MEDLPTGIGSDIVDSAVGLWSTCVTQAGLCLAAAVALLLLQALIAHPASWRKKGVFLLVLANEVRGALFVGGLAWAFLRH